jgi:hypothetical protein
VGVCTVEWIKAKRAFGLFTQRPAT